MNFLVLTQLKNGVAEHKNDHLLDITKALIFTKKIPKQNWGEAILTAVHIINKLTSFEQPHS